MAGHQEAVATKAYRSGGDYLLVRGTLGRLVLAGRPDPSPPTDVQSLLSHCNIQGSWDPVDAADLPPAVAAVAAQTEWPAGED